VYRTFMVGGLKADKLRVFTLRKPINQIFISCKKNAYLINLIEHSIIETKIQK
jgi:hypothetical protein